jgi:hypothetical protein
MLLDGQNYRSVVILGAGATRGAYKGITRARILPPLNQDFFRVAERFTRVAGARQRQAFERLRRFLEGEVQLRSTNPLTMEEMFNILFISKDLPRVFRRGGPIRSPGFRREVKDFVSLVVALLRYVQQNPRHPHAIDHHLSLARALFDGDTIVSLNYDTLIDNALLLTGWDPGTGYGFDARKQLRFAGASRSTLPPRDIALLKPHGSLNWFAPGDWKSLEQVLFSRSPALVLFSSVPRAYDLRSKQMIRFFVPPLYTKFFANDFWRRIWEQTFLDLVNAEALIVVGCSIVESDFHLRSILVRALKARSGRFKRLIIIEPSQEVRGQLRKLFRGSSVTGPSWHPDFTSFVRARLARP